MTDILLNTWWKKTIYVLGWIWVLLFTYGMLIGLYEGFNNL